MALSKQFLYDQEEQTLSQFARALSHSARIKILKQLHIKGSSCVQEIAREHPISNEALSEHLKILREAHLVNWRERFPYTFYEADQNNLKRAKEYIAKFFNQLDMG